MLRNNFKSLIILILIGVVSVNEAEGQIRDRIRRATAIVEGNPARTLISEANVEVIGHCRIPNYLALGASTFEGPNFGGYLFNNGLAHIVIAGTGYFLATANGMTAYSSPTDARNKNGIVYRFHPDTLSTNPAAIPDCVIDADYGDPNDGKRRDLNGGGSYDGNFSGPIGFLVDGSNLFQGYWTDPYSNDCSGSQCPNPSIIRSTIGSTDITGQAAYSVENWSFKRRAGSITPIPTWYQSAFGGYSHIFWGNGYGSGQGATIDPSAIAMNLPTGADLDVIQDTDYEILATFDFNSCGERLNFPSWLPARNTYLSCSLTQNDWLDNINDHYIFVDTSSDGTDGFYGILSFGTHALGGTQYIAASVQLGGVAHGITVWDPQEFIDVVDGAAPSSVVYANSWERRHPVINYSLFPYSEVKWINASCQAIASTDRVRCNFPSVHNMIVGSQFFIFNSTSFNNGYTVAEVIDTDTVDSCAGQNCGDIPTDISLESNLDIQLVTNFYYGAGKTSGAVFMKTNSACLNENNTFAEIWDDNLAAYNRYLTCYRLVVP